MESKHKLIELVLQDTTLYCCITRLTGSLDLIADEAMSQCLVPSTIWLIQVFCSHRTPQKHWGVWERARARASVPLCGGTFAWFQSFHVFSSHNCCFLFQTEIAPTRFLAVDRGLLDDCQLNVVLDPLSLELPDVGWQRSVLEFVVPLGWRIEGVVPLVREAPVVMVESIPQRVFGLTCVDLELWDHLCWNWGVGGLILEACLVDWESWLARLIRFCP